MRNKGGIIALEEGYGTIVFSDFDVFFTPNWTSELCHIIDEHNPPILSGVNLALGTTWWDFYHDVNGTLNGRCFINTNDLLFVTTATLAVKSEVFEKIQFNTAFNDAAGEDIDFCLRARKEKVSL